MRHLIALLFLSVGLTACATFDAAKFAEAANALDPDCYKRTEITVTPLLVFGWPVPIVAAKHVKECAGKQSAPVSSDLSSINLGSLVQ